MDGQQLSNTLWLEQNLNWTGLLIEPDHYSFQHLRYKHRRAWTSNACLSSNALTKRTIHVSKHLRPGVMAIPWHMRGSSYEYGQGLIEGKDIPKWAREWHNGGDNSYHNSYCFPLHSYLLALNVTTIDLLSLDTEGTEVDIVKSIPWEEVKVRVLVVEMQRFGDYKTRQAKFVDYMQRKGFLLLNKQLDFIFVKDGDSALNTLKSFSDWNELPKTSS